LATAKRNRTGSDRLARQQIFNPARDGCVPPILHLNGYKIANPTLLARIPWSSSRVCCRRGYGHASSRERSGVVIRRSPRLDGALARIRDIWKQALREARSCGRAGQ
jgi:xylulose-5-phosphate/fructose-6-phosphate phosphoketolase